MSETVGDVFDRRGPCALMSAVIDLAQSRGRIPVGHWRVELPDGWTLEINGTAAAIGNIPPWHATMTAEYNGWPVVVLFDTVDGQFIGPPGTEDRAIAAIKAATK